MGLGRLAVENGSVAAEPSDERLSHVLTNHARTCPACGEEGTTQHLMWQCPSTEPLRQKFDLDWRHQSQEAGTLPNGWFALPPRPICSDHTYSTFRSWVSNLLSWAVA